MIDAGRPHELNTGACFKAKFVCSKKINTSKFVKVCASKAMILYLPRSGELFTRRESNGGKKRREINRGARSEPAMPHLSTVPPHRI